ncbi:MAG: dependent ligase domain [Chloroflexota bacterium]|nr:dependent ligase domain [Chloroflexota bacterium]
MESQAATGHRAPAGVADWRPQQFGSGSTKNVVDPIIEPAWNGQRTLVRIGFGDAIELIDADGQPVVGPTGIVAAISAATRASSLILDGYLTDQATRTSEGLMLAGAEAPSVGDMTAQLVLGSIGRRRRQEASRPRQADAAGEPTAFVAVDLLLVDDESIVDVPLLERKRILEAVFAEGELVRRTAFVRPPINPWIGTWRSMGFSLLAYKAANSRYLPGRPNREWALARIPQR